MLAALLRSQGVDTRAAQHRFALGAASVVDNSAWILVSDGTEGGSGLGAALAWSIRRHVDVVRIIAEHGASVMARRAAYFDIDVDVFGIAGTAVARTTPAPVDLPPPPAPAHLGLIPVIERAGAEAVVEYGVVTGEVRGLEVCRVVDEPGSSGMVRLEVGVGVHDREAFAMIHGDVPPDEALAGVVRAVSDVRTPDGAPHPLRQLAAERLLRWRIEREPELIGLDSVARVPPPVARRNVSDAVPCCALGRRSDGTPVVVVCSVGVDLDAVPYAADARSSVGNDLGVENPETLLVVPRRDAVPMTHELAAQLRAPFTVVAVDDVEPAGG